MPYDAPDYQTVLWDSQGKPYWNTASGKRMYIPPMVAAQYRDDPRLREWAKGQGVSIDYQTDPVTGEVTVGSGGVTNNAAPGGSLFKERGQWNSEKGQWDQPVNWSNIMALGVGGAMAAPFVVPALAAAGGGGAALPSAAIPQAGGAALGGLGSAGSGAVGSALAGEAALGGAAAGGAAAGGAAAGGAAGGAFAGGVGIGETSAMTGVAGSGFGPAVLPSAATAASGGVPAAAMTGAMPMTAGAAPGNAALLAAAKGGSGMLGGMTPEMWQLAASTGAGYLNTVGQGKNQKAADAAAMERLRMQTAADESTRDPFRQQMSQIQDLGRLDMMQQLKPLPKSAPVGKYAGVVAPGQLDSYAPSADMLNWLASMKRNVASGESQAPTMTNPSNYGKSSAMNLPSGPYASPSTPLMGAPASPYQSQMSLQDMLGLARSGGMRAQVQDKWGRSPGDPEYGKPPAGGGFTV